MLSRPTPTSFHALASHAVYSFNPTTPTILHCLQGQIWVTLSAVARDFILQPGMYLTVQAEHLCVVEAFCNSQFSLCAAAIPLTQEVKHHTNIVQPFWQPLQLFINALNKRLLGLR